MPIVQKIQPIVFRGRCQAIRAPTVPKRTKAMPVQMILTSRNRFLTSRHPITVAERIKDAQMPQTTQANRCAVPGLAVFSAKLNGECM